METVEFTAIKSKVMFPKSGTYKDGDFAIVSVELRDIIKGNVPVHRQYGTITIKGSLPKMENSVYRIIGNLEYSEQYKSYSVNVLHIDKYVEDLDLDKYEDFIQYVMTEAELKLLRKVPNTKEVLDSNSIDELVKVKGIGKRKAKTILDKYNQDRSVILHKVKLAKYGVGDGLTNRLLDKYKSFEVIISKVEENPYMLTEDNIYGVGFKSIDNIALTMNIEPTDHRRVRAYIIYRMREELANGKTFVYTTKFLEQLYTELYEDKEVDKAVISMVFTELFADNTLWRSEDKTRLSLVYARNIEYRLAQEIKRIHNGIRKDNLDNWDKAVKKLEELQGWDYNEQQYKAIETVMNNNNNFIVVTGGAGTGKTSVLSPLLGIMSNREVKIMQTAPTGKASKRMEEVTGIESKTIHRLLQYSPNAGFKYNKNNKLECDILIIDESSMINGKLFLDLLEAIETGTKVIILGDPFQLPCIGMSAVLLDLIESNVVSICFLTETMRQAKESGILSTSTLIRNNQHFLKPNAEGNAILGDLQDLELCVIDDRDLIVEEVLVNFEKHLEEFKDIMEVQVGVLTRTRGKLSAFNINNRIKDIVNPIKPDDVIAECKLDAKNSYRITTGDKVIITKNNYSAKLVTEEEEDDIEVAIFNGNIGIVTKVDIDYMIIDVPDVGEVEIDSAHYNTVELGYAITIHKSQGSEYKCFIVAVTKEAYLMLNSELLYTGVTRAKKKGALIGENEAIRRCCSNRGGNTKLSFLQEFLIAN